MSTLVHAHPSPIPLPRFTPETMGLALGLTAAGIWGAYLAMARAGISSGLGAPEIAVFRYGVAGLVMLPWLLRHGPLHLAGIGWRRASVLALLAGPLFVLIGAGGYRFAPLAHGAVVQPAALTLSAMLAAWLMFGERLSSARIAGMVAIIGGLAVIAGPGLLSGGQTAPIGDAMFAVAGMMWAAFAILSKRWGVNPVAATAVVSVLSALAYVPLYAFVVGFDRLAATPAAVLLPQIVVQGVLSGVVAVMAFARAVQLVGASRAAVFPALVPASAIMLGWPIAGEVPTLLQAIGLGLVTGGLLISVGLFRRRGGLG